MHSPIIHASKDSRRSDDSQDSRSTAPTSLYSSAGLSLHPPTERPVYAKPYDVSPATTYYPRSSTETYLSGASEEDLRDELDEYDHDYDVPELKVRDEVNLDLRPSTPQDFAELLSSSKRLYVRHDDTTYDGNMNLRVDTEDPFGGPRANIQLFHMRMHDLKKREFSIRRYERSSGREVCHSSRKYKSTSDRKPNLTRSMSSALATITGGSSKFKRTNSGLSARGASSSKPIKRQDSGYGSSQEDEEHCEASKPTDQVPTNAIKLEFSNYAVVEVKRRGAKSSKRYEFEYWGHLYSWKRAIEQDGEGKAVSFHLHKDDGHVVAHIVPEMRSPSQIRAEAVAGGWVPPCSMWVSDHSILEAHTDVADVIVATGLIALTDDCIKRHFHPEAATHHQVNVPLTPLKIDLAGPKAMAEHVFKRRGSASSNKEKDHKGSPLKFESPVIAACTGAY
jgi:hypothetical protein